MKQAPTPAVLLAFMPQRVRLSAWLAMRRFSSRRNLGGAILSKTTKVLLAEDDPNFVRYLVALLEQMSCEIAIERNGDDAIRRAATFQPDVALVGFVMPGMEGCATGIGLINVSPHTKVVFISERVSAETLDSLKAQGHAFNALPAPFERGDLEVLIEASSRK